jgi:hypothetical protein
MPTEDTYQTTPPAACKKKPPKWVASKTVGTSYVCIPQGRLYCVLQFGKLQENNPNQLRHNMAAAMGNHRITQTVLSVQPAKEQTKATIQQEASDNDHW